MATLQLLKGRVLAFIGEAEPQTDDGIAARYNIETFLKEAVAELLLTAPASEVPVTDFSVKIVSKVGTNGETIKEKEAVVPTPTGDKGVCTVDLPTGYLRLVEFRLAGWLRSATTPLAETDPEYTRQANRWTMGTPERPAVCVEREPDGSQVLWCYSAPKETEPTIERARCVTLCEPTAVPDPLVDALCWLAASSVLAVAGEGEAATYCHTKYERILTMHYGSHLTNQ